MPLRIGGGFRVGAGGEGAEGSQVTNAMYGGPGGPAGPNVITGELLALVVFELLLLGWIRIGFRNNFGG